MSSLNQEEEGEDKVRRGSTKRGELRIKGRQEWLIKGGT